MHPIGKYVPNVCAEEILGSAFQYLYGIVVDEDKAQFRVKGDIGIGNAFEELIRLENWLPLAKRVSGDSMRIGC